MIRLGFARFPPAGMAEPAAAVNAGGDARDRPARRRA